MTDILTTLNLAAQTIYDKKGSNILGLDLRQVSVLTDYVIIAEGNVHEHVRAIAKELLKNLEKAKISCYHQEGMQEGDWIVLDFLDFIIHIFTPQIRMKYSLEELWKEAEILKLKIDIKGLNLEIYGNNFHK